MIIRLGSLLLLALLAVPAARADTGEAGLVWQIDGERNRVYLVGSIHLLRAGDYPLPATLESAYADAEGLVMELDMDDLDEDALAAGLFAMGRATGGETLATLIGEARFAEASAQARELGIDLSRLLGVEPWLAAMTIEQMVMMRGGFEPRFGLERHFTDRAIADGKPIVGLERALDQLRMLDELDSDVQADLLMLTLDEAAGFETSLDQLVASWRAGDSDDLERRFVAPMREHPVVYDVMLKRRNAAWVPLIEGLLDDHDDSMIIVGAAHLIGEDSVVELLAARGYRLTRLR